MTAIALSRDRWSLTHELTEGGIVLGDLRHDGFSLANDLRVTRVWVATDIPSRGGGMMADYRPGSATLPAMGPVAELPHPLPRPGTPESAIRTVFGNPPPRGVEVPSSLFKSYQNVFGLSASFATVEPFLKGTPNECPIRIEQRHLFGDYGRNPPHEPGAVLDATRLFPIVRFELPAVKDRTKPFPRYVRVDFRIDVALDNIGEAAMQRAPAQRGDTRNKAAIFRDAEAAPDFASKAFIGAQVALSVIGGSGPSVSGLFAALEKPLKYEIATRGLVGGDAPGWSPLDTWDNLHVWAAKRGEGDESISTPGAFHALHCHWRWGAVVGDPAADKALLPAAGQPQFTGQGWTKTAGGPLIARELPRQNVSIAVTRNDAPQWRKEANPSACDFASLFSNVRQQPAVIEKGDNLVVWYSFEAFRNESETDRPWGGPFFVNGMYFAHGVDRTPMLAKLGGAYGEASSPSPRPVWTRRAR